MKNFECTLVKVSSGEKLWFPSVSEASRAIGRASGYISNAVTNRRRITGADGTAYVADTGGELEKSRETQILKNYETSDINPNIQLCCYCSKFAGGCSWSAKFIPVKGWVAKPTIIRHYVGAKYNFEVASYKIKECPEFERG